MPFLYRRQRKSSATIVPLRFDMHQRWRDLFFSLLFIASLICVLIIAFMYRLPHFDELFQELDRSTKITDVKRGLLVTALVFATAILTGACWTLFLQIQAKTMIRTAIQSSLGAQFLAATWLFLNNRASLGFACLIISSIEAIWYRLIYDRIGFVTVLLELAADCNRNRISLLLVTTFVQLGIGVWICVFFIALSSMFPIGFTSDSSSSGIIFFLFVSLIWTLEVMRNLMRVTGAGVCASFLLHDRCDAAVTWQMFFRVLTKSFGSVCFGSAFVGIVSITKEIMYVLRNTEIKLDCLESVTRVLRTFCQLFTKYAFVNVAVFGKSFLTSARITRELMNEEGINTIFAEDLSSFIMTISGFLGGIITSAIGSFSCESFMNLSEDELGAISVAFFFAGMFIWAISISAITVCVSTILMLWAEDPHFALSHPDIDAKLNAAVVEFFPQWSANAK